MARELLGRRLNGFLGLSLGEALNVKTVLSKKRLSYGLLSCRTVARTKLSYLSKTVSPMSIKGLFE